MNVEKVYNTVSSICLDGGEEFIDAKNVPLSYSSPTRQVDVTFKDALRYITDLAILDLDELIGRYLFGESGLVIYNANCSVFLKSKEVYKVDISVSSDTFDGHIYVNKHEVKAVGYENLDLNEWADIIERYVYCNASEIDAVSLDIGGDIIYPTSHRLCEIRSIIV